jgi:biopolymer transport protein ExbB/TolQ
VWLYLVLAVATLMVLAALIVAVVAVIARRAVRERDFDLRARLEQYSR